MLRWATAVLTVVLVGGLAFGFWWITAPGLPEGDRLGFALLVGLFGLLSGGVAYLLGNWAGRHGEREAARSAAEALRIRRERMEAQLAARRAERDQILAGAGQNPRLTGGPPP